MPGPITGQLNARQVTHTSVSLPIIAVRPQARLQGAGSVQEPGQVQERALAGPHCHRHPTGAGGCEEAAAHDQLHHLHNVLQQEQSQVGRLMKDGALHTS